MFEVNQRPEAASGLSSRDELEAILSALQLATLLALLWRLCRLKLATVSALQLATLSAMQVTILSAQKLATLSALPLATVGVAGGDSVA